MPNFWNPISNNMELWENKPNGYLTEEEGLAWLAEQMPVIPLPSLEEAKKQAKQELKEYRKQIEYGGFMLNGQRWDSEEKDELRLLGINELFKKGLTEYPGWKLEDGVYVTLTPELLDEVMLAFAHHTGAAFALEAAKLAQINALESSEAVLAWLESDMKTGWEQPEPEVNPDA